MAYKLMHLTGINLNFALNLKVKALLKHTNLTKSSFLCLSSVLGAPAFEKSVKYPVSEVTY